MKVDQTERGFDISAFTDHRKVPCNIQQSSWIGPDTIWLGCMDPGFVVFKPGCKPRSLSKKQVEQRLGGEVSVNTRMLLTQDMVKELLPHLQRFAETGEI